LAPPISASRVKANNRVTAKGDKEANRVKVVKEKAAPKAKGCPVAAKAKGANSKRAQALLVVKVARDNPRVNNRVKGKGAALVSQKANNKAKGDREEARARIPSKPKALAVNSKATNKEASNPAPGVNKVVSSNKAKGASLLQQAAMGKVPINQAAKGKYRPKVTMIRKLSSA
jgi:hypothetical protein